MRYETQRSQFDTAVWQLLFYVVSFSPKTITTGEDTELTCYDIFPIAIPLL